MVVGCESGARTVCDTPGIIPPPPPEEDINLGAQNDDGAPPNELGCGCQQNKQPLQQGRMGLYALIVVLGYATRRRKA